MALRRCFLTKQQLEEISKRMNDGENRGQIAKDFNMDIATIRKLLKKMVLLMILILTTKKLNFLLKK